MSTLLHPVMRKATISRPQDTLKERADHVAASLCASWKTNASDYVELINGLLGKDAVDQAASLSTQEARIEDEGESTVVVDYPMITAKWKDYSFEIRTTVAICRKEASTKNWTRVSVADGLSYSDEEKETVRELQGMYDKLATKCSTLSHDIFEQVVESLYAGNKVESIGNFTIMTFGIQDDQLGQYLDLFDDVDLKLKDLFTQNAEAKKLIRSYYENLFGRGKVNFNPTNGESYWLRSVSDYVSQEGFVEEGKALYNIKVDEDQIFALGIGHDVPGASTSIAKLSSLKVARYFGLEI